MLAYFITSKVTLDSVLNWHMCHEIQIPLLCINLLTHLSHLELRDNKTL